LLLAAGLSCTGFIALAQTPTGVIQGTVTDTSGSVVPDAQVTVSDQATNIRWSTRTNDVGDYRVPFLPPGRYSVSVERPGFARQVFHGFAVEVDRTIRVNFSIAPGELTQTVEVNAQSQLIDTETSATGKVVTGKQIVDLPLNGRNYLQLALLAPGVVRSGITFVGLFTDPAAVPISAVGQRAEQNNFILDGIDNKEPLYNQPAINPSVDAVGEFKVITGIAPAQYGRGGGAIISAVTRAGTNQLHGNLFEFLRNNAMDARSYFADRTSHLVRNQFGGSLGGPVYLPGLYNGRDKTFFFANVDFTRQRSAGAPPQAIVPMPAMRGGAFVTTITDPATGQPFPNNTIPTARMNSLSLKLQELFPLPNRTSVQNFIYNDVASTRSDADYYVARVDHLISDRDNLYVRYAFSKPTILRPPRFPSGVGSEAVNNKAQGASLAEVHTFGPRAVNEFRFGWQRREFSDNSQLAFTRNVLSELGVTGVATDPLVWSYPSLSIAGFTTLNDPAAIIQDNDVFQFSDLVTIQAGRHSFQIGGDLRWMPHSRQALLPSIASWSFGAPAFTGQAYADFLLGLPRSTGGLLSPHIRSESVKYFSGYIQDDWKVSANLTLNLGLRYELETPIRVADKVFSGIDLQTGTLLIPRELEPVAGPFYRDVKTDTPVRFVDVDSPYDIDKNNFAPRIGLAYRPWRLTDTVLRAGFGVFYVSPPWQSFSIDELAPFNIRPVFNSDPTVPTLDMRPIPGGLGDLARAPLTIFPFGNRDILLGYNQQWMFEIQQGLSANWVAAVAYTGSSGHHMPRLTQGNLGTPGPGQVQNRLRFPWFARIQYLEPAGNSSYQGVSFRVERRFAGGSGLSANYTYSKTIDDAASTNLVVHVSDPLGRRFLEKALSDLDVRHNFVANFTYMLPIGKGRRLLSNASRPVEALFGNWQAAGIWTMRSTPPTTVTMSPSRVNFAAGGVQAHPDRIRDDNLPEEERTAARWFETSAFVLPPPFTAGTGGRNTILNPGAIDLDLSLSKIFRASERWSVLVRGEFFNAFNHVNYGPARTDFETPATFGQVVTRSGPRILQIGMRVDF
jgi:hypothetical protein